jgi:hypothetical protein
MTEQEKKELLEDAKQDAIDILNILGDAPKMQPRPKDEVWPVRSDE